MALLDTNIISEMRKLPSGRANSGVEHWSKGVSLETMYLSAITVSEMEIGILRMRLKDPPQAELLAEWLHRTVLPSFAARILPVDTEIALRCATLHVPRNAPYRDSLIAATALVHGLTVVTRNVKDFEPSGVNIVNPWLELQ